MVEIEGDGWGENGALLNYVENSGELLTPPAWVNH
jgi:hypothetical protein